MTPLTMMKMTAMTPATAIILFSITTSEAPMSARPSALLMMLVTKATITSARPTMARPMRA